MAMKSNGYVNIASSSRYDPTQRYTDVRVEVRKALVPYIGKWFALYGNGRKVSAGVESERARLVSVHPHCAVFEVKIDFHKSFKIAPPLAVIARYYKPEKVEDEPWEFFDFSAIKGEKVEEDE